MGFCRQQDIHRTDGFSSSNTGVLSPKNDMTEGSFEDKLPTMWTDGKTEMGRVREEKRRREKIREEKESEERRHRWTKKVGKPRFTVFYDLWLWLAKAVGAEPSSQMRDEKLHAGAKHISK